MTKARTGIALLAALVAAAALAGCLGGAEDVEDQPSAAGPETIENQSTPQDSFPDTSEDVDPDEEEGEGTDESSHSVLTYENLEAPIRESSMHEGSFSTQESCNGGGCLVSGIQGEQTYTDRVEITDKIPAHVAVHVTVNVTYEGRVSELRAHLELTDGTLYNQEWGVKEDGDTVRSWVSADVVRTEGAEVHAVAWASFASPPEQEYEMGIALEADPVRVPPRVPVATPLEDTEASPLVQTGDQAEGVTLRAWGPEDRIVHDERGIDGGAIVELGVDEGGEHVVASRGDEASFAIAAPGEDPHELRALTLSTTHGEAHDPSPQGNVEWTSNVDQVPYNAGIYVEVQDVSMFVHDFEASLTSPEGTIVEGDHPGRGGTGTFYVTSDLFHPNIVPGEWTGEASSTVMADAQVGTFFVDYER